MVISLATRAQFIIKVERGISIAEASRQCGINRRSGTRFWKKYLEDGRNAVPEAKKPPGRTSRVTLAHIVTIRRTIFKHPFWSTRKIWQMRPSLQGLTIDNLKKIIRQLGMLPLNTFQLRKQL